MEGKQKCEVAGCNNPAQIVVTANGDPINCCRNHATDIINRVEKLKGKYKVEPIPREP